MILFHDYLLNPTLRAPICATGYSLGGGKKKIMLVGSSVFESHTAPQECNRRLPRYLQMGSLGTLSDARDFSLIFHPEGNGGGVALN